MEEFFTKVLGIPADTQYKLLESVIYIVLIVIIQRIVKRILVSKVEDLKVRYQWQKISLYLSVFLILLILSNVWLQAFGSVGTFLGLVSAGIAIALKDPLVNMVGWIFILIRQPFKVGDRIQIGKFAGDVIDIRLFQFSLNEIGNWVNADQSTGRIIHVPNGTIFIEPQANYTAGFKYIWNEIPVLVTFESNWKKAKQILTEVVNKHAVLLSGEAEKQIKEAAKKFLIFYTKLTPIVYTSVEDSGVLLTLRYMCDPRERRLTTEKIWEDILDRFAQCDDIDFAYPTQRFYNNITEGKPEAKAKIEKPS
ncbi:mechanosensitive ion channel domain-containing protein [Ignavibacterium sp.]|uniref:mechanosensitive ion channel family protein n=1 Tax=Ignavibacterium sp. TaxID=2651167 RepID=UPI002208B9D4|nr:mechanosensitive ion channel domain-containing protein [Ignavibacterium sp.]BDQ03336.1 MAG: mechanosensitive ion channel protein MscS [Ignavibacterium sp.]